MLIGWNEMYIWAGDFVSSITAKSSFIVENITHLLWKFHLNFNHLYYFDSHNNHGYRASPRFHFTVPLALKMEMTHDISSRNIHIIYLAARLPVSHATMKWVYSYLITHLDSFT